MRNLIDAAIVFAISLILFYAAAWAQTYTVTDLGDLQPVAVINGPKVFGNLGGEPVVWQGGQTRTLQHYGYGGQVNGANGRGDSVGWVWLSTPGQAPRRVAAFWYPDGQVTILPATGEAEARGLNMARTIAGQNFTSRRTMRWFPGGVGEELAGVWGVGIGVDAADRIWGRNDVFYAIWDADGTAHFIGMSPEGPHGVSVIAVNDTYGVGGNHLINAAVRLGYLREQIVLPRPSNAHTCNAFGVNNRDVIVGACVGAVLWPNTTTVIDLSVVTGLPLGSARDISDDGHIVGLTGGQGWLLTPQQAPPALALQLNAHPYQLGDTLRMALRMSNPGPMLTVDHYVGIILPDGDTVFWVTNTAPLDGVITSLSANPSTFVPLLRGVMWPAGMDVTQQDYLTFRWTGLEPQGTYHLVVGWTKAGSLADGVIDEGDIVALDWKAFQVLPQMASR